MLQSIKKTKRKPYKHLTRTDRIKIETLYNEGFSKAEIARKLHKHRSTIGREIKKGLYEHLLDYKEVVRYSYDKAQIITDMNTSHRGIQQLKIDGHIDFANFIEKELLDKKSPEIALRNAKKQGFSFSLCVNTVYTLIEIGYFENISLSDLPQRHKRKKRKVKVYKIIRTDAPTIDDRPEEIETRETFGNWEMDTVKGRRGTTKGCLLVLTERKTRQEIIHYMKNQKAESVVEYLDYLEKKYGDNFKEIFKTITVDNGSEFADYEGMVHSFKLDPDGKQQKRTEIYYCHPYASWERGSNENNKRMIRRFIPKGKDFDKITPEQVQKIEDWINNYPRRMFNFRTSQQLYLEEIKLIA